MGYKKHFLPEIIDEKTAKKTARQGIWASLWVGISITLLALIFKNYLGLVDAVLFFIIAFGIYKMSKFAAYSGLFLYIVEVAANVYSNHKISNLATAIIIIIMFVNGVRGTVAYNKLKKEKSEDIEKNLTDYQKMLEEKINNPFA